MIEAHKEGKFSWEKEIETLRRQLAEYQERLTKALALVGAESQIEAECNQREMIAKAGEVAKERCRKVVFDMAYTDSMAVDMSQTIRTLPGVTLEDLK